MTKLLRRAMAYAKHHGVGYTLVRTAEKAAERVLRTYDKQWRLMRTSEAELQRQREHPVQAGLISVIVPVYNTDPGMLAELVDSLLAQTYPDWEAVLWDDCSPSEVTRGALQAAAQQDERIRVFRGETNQGISGGTNSAVEKARGEWIALLDHDDLLTPDALYRVAETIAAQQPDLVYSDEDKVTQDGSQHTDPHFKPDFCPDNLRSENYFCHLMVIRRRLMEQVGGLRTAFNGSQDHDLALRCVEQAGKVAHIPQVLYHWRTVKSSVSHQNLMKCADASCRAVEEHMRRIGWPGKAEPYNGKIRLHYDIKGQPAVKVFLVGGGDTAVWQRQSWPVSCQVIDAGENRYAAMNAAAAAASEDVLLFVDASVQVADDHFVEEMLMYAQRDDVGAVTAELVNRRDRVTHAGFAVDMDDLVQCRQAGISRRAGGWHLAIQTSHNVAAVSTACVMIRRDHYIPIDENYHTELAAVDWSLRLGKMGLRHVFTPHACAVCVNRELLLLDSGRNAQDVQHYNARWAGVKDPCYSRHYARKKANYKLK